MKSESSRHGAKRAPNTESAQEAERTLRGVLDFWTGRGRWVTLGLAAAVVVVGGLRTWQWRRARMTARASEKFSAARTIQELESIVSDYAATPVAPLAMLRGAKAYYDNGHYEAALAKYGEFELRYARHPLAAVAEIGRLHCLEAQGRTVDAEQGFAAFVARHTNHFLRPQALFAWARCLEQMGRDAEARMRYEDFITEHPESRWRPHAEELLSAVKEKLGEKSENFRTPTNHTPEEQASAPDRLD